MERNKPSYKENEYDQMEKNVEDETYSEEFGLFEEARKTETGRIEEESKKKGSYEKS